MLSSAQLTISLLLGTFPINNGAWGTLYSGWSMMVFRPFDHTSLAIQTIKPDGIIVRNLPDAFQFIVNGVKIVIRNWR